MIISTNNLNKFSIIPYKIQKKHNLLCLLFQHSEKKFNTHPLFSSLIVLLEKTRPIKRISSILFVRNNANRFQCIDRFLNAFPLELKRTKGCVLYTTSYIDLCCDVWMWKYVTAKGCLY